MVKVDIYIIVSLFGFVLALLLDLVKLLVKLVKSWVGPIHHLHHVGVETWRHRHAWLRRHVETRASLLELVLKHHLLLITHLGELSLGHVRRLLDLELRLHSWRDNGNQLLHRLHSKRRLGHDPQLLELEKDVFSYLLHESCVQNVLLVKGQRTKLSIRTFRNHNNSEDPLRHHLMFNCRPLSKQ